ncbi:pinopsin-like [Tribolium madens]|uniref:pinopsin-like n=1 Tax=Tribolium madens TaxID=41895 RepID=UPI001CF74663|nr:pinopsin-like [Tribolium madens]XP_044254443.1 pinopsin-like [Tribolium madens]
MKNFNLTEIDAELLIPVEGYIAAAVVLFCIGFFGFSLNLTVIIFMLKERQLWSPINIILFNLVVSDFLVSVLGNPWTFFSAINYKWIFGKTGCTIYGFIMSLLGITSITTLTVLAFERYLLIARPFRNNALNLRNAAFSVFSIWLYSLCLTIPPLIGWGEYVHEAANLSCSVNWEEKSSNSTTYILYLFAFGLFLPLVVITFSYVNIILTMRRNAFRVGQVSKAENKVAYMIFIMIIAFLTAWSPYAIMALIIQFGDASLVTPGIAVIPALLAKSSICYNPVIYIGLNAQFQHVWLQKWKKNHRGSDTLGTSRMMQTINEDEKTGKLLGKKLQRCKDLETDVSML